MSPRKKQKRTLTIIEGICFVVFFLSMAAMNSEAWWMPATALALSTAGLFICYKLEEGRYRNGR